LVTYKRTKSKPSAADTIYQPRRSRYGQVLAGRLTMSRADLLCKADECARALEAITDPERREALAQLRKLWMTLARDYQFLLENDFLADQIAEAGRIHMAVMATLNATFETFGRH
jgi:hypothetical protein